MIRRLRIGSTHIDVGGFGLDYRDLTRFVTGNIPCRLDDRSWVKSSDSYAWKEWGEQEEVLWANDNLK